MRSSKPTVWDGDLRRERNIKGVYNVLSPPCGMATENINGQLLILSVF